MLSQAPCLQPRLSPSWCLADLPLGLAWLGHEIWKVNSQRSYQCVSGADDTELCSHLHLEVRREPWLSEQQAVPASSPSPELGCHTPRKGQKLHRHSQGSRLSCVLELWDPSMPPRKNWGVLSGLLWGVGLCNDCTDPVSAVKLSVTLLPGPLS